ncbi:probable wound-induced proteinase inhibitor 1 at C-terminar half [Coccomyxa sp. Obi]|nr:probable wound-induced proteinase inhibitor 1 at C-terminar half [Coccomyxa sp. Obi]
MKSRKREMTQKMRPIHAAVLLIYCQALLWNLAAPQICLAQGSTGAQASGSSPTEKASIPIGSPALTDLSAALPPLSAPAPARVLFIRTSRPELSAESIRLADRSSSQPTRSRIGSLESSAAVPAPAMPPAPQQAPVGLGPTAGNVQSSQDTAASSGLASDATTSGGGVNAWGGSLSGQGASTGGGASSAGAGGVSDTASLGNPGGLVFDGAGNIVSGVQSAFGDVPASYTGKQEWPELVGTNALAAKAKLKAETGLNVVLVPQGSVVTTDYRADRIRIYFDPDTYLVVQPRPSVG